LHKSQDYSATECEFADLKLGTATDFYAGKAEKFPVKQEKIVPVFRVPDR
jgi:hypothetical protein